MRNLVTPVLICVLLFGFAVSCEKLTVEQTAGMDQTAPLSELPASYGQLVSVTTSTAYPGWFQLWFEDNAGVIRIVRVQMAQNVMHKQVKIINRVAGL
jgi:hypothetical protein